MATTGVGTNAFGRWQELQRELHELERRIVTSAREAAQGFGSGVSREMVEQAQRLRIEVDALFPAAMRELEAQVNALDARRPTLGDL